MKLILNSKIKTRLTRMNNILLNNNVYECESDIPSISTKMDLNKERVLGTCKYISKKLFEIRLNKTLYNKIGDEYLDDVFTHEYAHAITDDLYGLGVKPHGREFKSICRLLGIEGKATTDLLERHNITLKSNRSYRTFEYRCDCQTHILKKKSHNKAHYGGYLCKLCKTRLNFVKEL